MIPFGRMGGDISMVHSREPTLMICGGSRPVGTIKNDEMINDDGMNKALNHKGDKPAFHSL